MSNISTYLGSGGGGGGGAGGESITPAGSAYCLTSDNQGTINACFNGQTGSLYLPSATTLETGSPKYTIKNTNTNYNIVLYDYDGNLYNYLEPFQSIQVSLYNNTCTAGGWVIEKPTTNQEGIAIQTTASWTADPANLTCFCNSSPGNKHANNVGCARRSLFDHFGFSDNSLQIATQYYDSDNEAFITGGSTCSVTNADGTAYTSGICYAERVEMMDAGVAHVFKSGHIVSPNCCGQMCVCCDTTLCWCCYGQQGGYNIVTDSLSTWAVHLPVCGSNNTQFRLYYTEIATGQNCLLCCITNTLPASCCSRGYGLSAHNQFRHFGDQETCRITYYKWSFGMCLCVGGTYDCDCLCNVCALIVEPCHRACGFCRIQPFQWSGTCLEPANGFPPIKSNCSCMTQAWASANCAGQLMFFGCFCRWISSFIVKCSSFDFMGSNHIGCFTSGGATCGQCFMQQVGNGSPRCGSSGCTNCDCFSYVQALLPVAPDHMVISQPCHSSFCPTGEYERQLVSINWASRCYNRSAMFQFCPSASSHNFDFKQGWSDFTRSFQDTSLCETFVFNNICYGEYQSRSAGGRGRGSSNHNIAGGGCLIKPGWKGWTVDYWTNPGILCWSHINDHNDCICICTVVQCGCASATRNCCNYTVRFLNDGRCVTANANAPFTESIMKNMTHYDFHDGIDSVAVVSHDWSGIFCRCASLCGCSTCDGVASNFVPCTGTSGAQIAADSCGEWIFHLTCVSTQSSVAVMKQCYDDSTGKLLPCCVIPMTRNTALTAGNIRCATETHYPAYSGLEFTTWANSRDGIGSTTQVHTLGLNGPGDAVTITGGNSYRITADPVDYNNLHIQRTTTGPIQIVQHGSSCRCLTVLDFKTACR